SHHVRLRLFARQSKKSYARQALALRILFDEKAMRISTTGALVDELRQYRLLTADRLAQLPKLAEGRHSDARAVAKALGQRGWLSVYQINQLLAGNARNLVYGPYHIVERL